MTYHKYESKYHCSLIFICEVIKINQIFLYLMNICFDDDEKK